MFLVEDDIFLVVGKDLSFEGCLGVFDHDIIDFRDLMGKKRSLSAEPVLELGLLGWVWGGSLDLNRIEWVRFVCRRSNSIPCLLKLLDIVRNQLNRVDTSGPLIQIEVLFEALKLDNLRRLLRGRN